MARSDTSAIPRTPYGEAIPAVCVAVLCIVAIDALPALAPATDGFVGKLDDLAHVATAIIAVLLFRPGRAFAAALVVASVAIDVDHVPHVLGWAVPNDGSGRPYHTLAVVALFLAVAAIAPRARTLAAGAAAGVAVHLLRDVATGPGVPLTWPISAAMVRLPYVVYACLVATAVVLVVARTRRRSESTSR
jgi:inner membrane protein